MRQLLLSLRAKLVDMVVVRTTKRLPQLMPDCQLALACHREGYCSGPDVGLLALGVTTAATRRRTKCRSILWLCPVRALYCGWKQLESY